MGRKIGYIARHFAEEKFLMKQRRYFEPFAAIGRKNAPDKYYPFMPEILLDDMKYARIHGAAILHNTALDHSYIYGNREGLALANGNSRLFALAAVPTTANLESGNPSYLNGLLNSGIRGFVMSPKLLCSLNPKNFSELADALIAHSRPLIFTMNTFPKEQYDRISEIAEMYPNLKILLHGVHWANARIVWNMLLRLDNLYFDISSFHINDILEKTKELLGIHRVVYSSAWPTKSMGAIKAMIEYANITEEDKDMVAHGNACKLFGVSPDELELYDDSECRLDSIASEADSGLPISVPVIDAHTHMIPKEDFTPNFCMVFNGDCDSMSKKAERLGIDVIMTAPFSGIAHDGILGIKEAVYAAQRHRDKYLAYGTCNANYKEDLTSWKDYYEQYPDIIVGLKPYLPNHKFSLSDDVYEEWFSYANKHRLPILVHADGSTFVSDVESVVKKYPNATFILAHAGASFDVALHHIELAKKYDNVVLEICYTTTGRGMIEFLVENVGADRVLYGSDQPMRNPAPQLAWVCYSKIPVEDKKKILAGNIQRILDKRI